MPGVIAMGARPDEVIAPIGWLTPIERKRAARLVFEHDRQAFIAAHLLVRLCGAQLLNVDPQELTLLQRCPIHGPGHGAPYLEQAPNLGISISHTRGYVCAAAGPGKVGIDAERIPAAPLDQSFATTLLAPGEVAETDKDLIRLWTRKEALIKRGELELDDLSTNAWHPPPHLLEWGTTEGILVCVATDHPARRVTVPAP